MQIVIDIPKKLYDRYKEKDYIKRCDIDEFEKALDSCIILPKGHGRLIDADALGEKEECYLSKDESISFFYVYSEDIIYAPTIIEADKEE